MVRFRNVTRFYRRNASSKYQLDVGQIRGAFLATVRFLATETITERLRQFRAERVAKIIADQTPAMLDIASRLIVHAIPLAAIDATSRLDVSLDASKGTIELVLGD